MNTKIDAALNLLYQRQIATRDQILKEMLRVKLTQAELEKANLSKFSKDKIFELMRQTATELLGIFPADRDDFLAIYNALVEIDLIEFACEVYDNDRTGVILNTRYLTDYLRGRLAKAKPASVLITEAEKHICGLFPLINAFPDSMFTLTTQNHLMNIFLKICFSGSPNVKIIFESIYSPCLDDAVFDYIFCVPAFGNKVEELNNDFLTRESDGVALENMLKHLAKDGVLDIIAPARIAFAALGFEKLRAYIIENYAVAGMYILPEGALRPMTSVKTYLLTIGNTKQAEVGIGTLSVEDEVWKVNDRKVIKKEEFLSHEDWRIELFMSEDDCNIRMFKDSALPKVKLKDVAEVFRGKSILKKETGIGNIDVLNISNIENGQIDYSALDSIEDDERKARRYQLQNGDVVISCRGTVIKSAVFEEQPKMVIASANLIAVRPGDKILGGYIMIFLESPIGKALLGSFQRGTTVMNINYTDIMEMEITLPEKREQQQIVEEYQSELILYTESLVKAEKRFAKTKDIIYRKLF